MTTIYHYDSVTHEYLSQTEASLDPLDQLPLIPAYATDVSVITPSPGNVAVFDGTIWIDTEDHRGTIYDTTTKSDSEHADLGALPVDQTDLVPSVNDIWDGSAWVQDLDLTKTAQKRVIRTAFNNEIGLGLTTNAIKMDANHLDISLLQTGYDFAIGLSETSMDIRDFNDVVNAGVPIATVLSMLSDLKSHFRTTLAKKWDLQSQIDAASTISAVESIVW